MDEKFARGATDNSRVEQGAPRQKGGFGMG